MPRLVFLGTSNAIPDENHENTYMAVEGAARLLLIDCSNNPLVRMKQTGLDLHALTDLILTHFHPDHVSGVPSLLMDSWILGRRKPLHLYGLKYTLERVEKVMDLYDWNAWPDFYPVEFHTIPEQERSLVFECPEFRVFASRVRHMVPDTGLRIESSETGKVVVYSCDTAPCDELVRLADQADVLIHEASGAATGHSSAAQAGEIARQAKVKHLYLIHYPTGKSYNPLALIEEAQQTFQGPVTVAKDRMEILF
jgi:ribonuclease Z